MFEVIKRTDLLKKVKNDTFESYVTLEDIISTPCVEVVDKETYNQAFYTIIRAFRDIENAEEILNEFLTNIAHSGGQLESLLRCPECRVYLCKPKSTQKEN